MTVTASFLTIFGKPDLSQALLLAPGMGINLAVAEWVVRRPARPAPSRDPQQPGALS
jgi:hypothetical protein